MNEYMKQQTSQMSSLVETVKKINPTPVTNIQSGPAQSGAGFMQQQRTRLDSLSKKHKLDDDTSPVFHPSGSSSPSFQPSNQNARRSTFQPPGSLSQPSQPQVQPLGWPAFQPQPPFQPAGMNNQVPSYANKIAAATQNNTNQPSGQHQ